MSTDANDAGKAGQGGDAGEAGCDGATLGRDEGLIGEVEQHHSLQSHQQGPKPPQTHAPICHSDQFIHKNRLQEYVQSSGIALPMYTTFNEGTQHALAFVSIVTVNGLTFRSTKTYRRRKEAEQDVAKVAFETLSRTMKYDGGPLISGDTMFCKSILYEFAIKMGIEKPTYSTVQSEGSLSSFVSTLIFGGKTYHGNLGKNKREAEQMAARAAIKSILENSNSRMIMSQIIKSKEKFFPIMHKVNSVTPQNDILDLLMQSVNHSCSSTMKVMEDQGTVVNGELPDKSLEEQNATPAAVRPLCLLKNPNEETIREERSQLVAQSSVPNTLIGTPVQPYSIDATTNNKRKRSNNVPEDNSPNEAKTDDKCSITDS